MVQGPDRVPAAFRGGIGEVGNLRPTNGTPSQCSLALLRERALRPALRSSRPGCCMEWDTWGLEDTSLGGGNLDHSRISTDSERIARLELMLSEGFGDRVVGGDRPRRVHAPPAPPLRRQGLRAHPRVGRTAPSGPRHRSRRDRGGAGAQARPAPRRSRGEEDSGRPWISRRSAGASWAGWGRAQGRCRAIADATLRRPAASGSDSCGSTSAGMMPAAAGSTSTTPIRRGAGPGPRGVLRSESPSNPPRGWTAAVDPGDEDLVQYVIGVLRARLLGPRGRGP